jgi:hypothetical protein
MSIQTSAGRDADRHPVLPSARPASSSDLPAAITAIGQHQFVWVGRDWAVLHDPEGHNVLLLQAGSPERSANLS